MHNMTITSNDYLSIDSTSTETNSTDTQLKFNNYKNKYKESIKKNQIIFNSVILCTLHLISYIDRYILSSVLIDIQNYYVVSKSLAGLLQTAFAVSLMLFSPLNGFLGDRLNRKYLLIASIILWMASTLGGSFVPEEYFYIFLLSRCIFGVATSTFETIALPIIGDTINNNDKTRNIVLGFFSLGPPLGIGLSYLIGIITTMINPNNWQTAMRITPFFLFFMLILIIFTYTEPDRILAKNETKSNCSFCFDLATLIKNKTYILLTLCWTIGMAALEGFIWWSPTLIEYSLRLQLPFSEIASYETGYSMIQCFGGIIGVMIPFITSEYLKRKFFVEFDCFFISTGFYLSSFFLLIYLLTLEVNIYFSIFVYSFLIISSNFCRILKSKIFLDIMPSYLRSTANSVIIFMYHLLGDSTTPYWVGLIADTCISDKYFETMSNLLYCGQISIYPLVALFFISGTFGFASSFTFYKDKQKVDSF